MSSSVPLVLQGLGALQNLRQAATIDPDACTRAHDSGCQACVLACPQQAITVGGQHQAPGVDPAACIGCGVCVPACPTGAVGGVGTPPERITRTATESEGDLTIRCGALAGHTSDSPEDEGGERFGVWCLASLHHETIAAAASWLEPGKTLTLQHADCDRCPIGAGTGVRDQTARGSALAARIAPDRDVVIERAEPPSPAEEQMPPAGEEPGEEPDRSRRALFGKRRPRRARRNRPEPIVTPEKLSRRALITGGRQPEPEPAPDASHPAPASSPPRVPVTQPGAVTEPRGALLAAAPGAPVPRPYAADGCTACRACSTICPTDALGWSDIDRRHILAVDAQSCIGCNECVRVCPEEVLALACPVSEYREMHSPAFPRIVTRVTTPGCTRCGEPLAGGEKSSCTRCDSRRGMLDDIWTQLDRR